MNKERAIEAIREAVEGSDRNYDRLVAGRYGGAERESGRGGGLRHAIEILRALPDDSPTVQRWTLDKILSVLDYATTHNEFATLTPAQVIAECVNLFTDFDGPGSPVFPDGPVVVEGPVECPEVKLHGVHWSSVVNALGDEWEFNFCPDCGTRLQGGEE